MKNPLNVNPIFLIHRCDVSVCPLEGAATPTHTKYLRFQLMSNVIKN